MEEFIGGPGRGPRTSSRSVAAVISVAALAAALAALVTVLTGPGAEPALAASEDHGASFAAPCDHAVQRRVDPYTQMSGAGSHLHEFFGATNPQADSTTTDLRTQTTTCQRELEQTSSYWMPAVRWEYQAMDGSREIAYPKPYSTTYTNRKNDAVIYYRHGDKPHRTIRAFRPGHKMLASPGTTTYNCDDGSGVQLGNPPDRCSTDRMEVRFKFPDCWDSNQAHDPSGFRARMKYARERADGSFTCEGVTDASGNTYETPMAQITMNVLFHSEAFNKPGNLRVSVDAADGYWAGTNRMHADFFNAWDQAKLETLTTRCINNVPPDQPRPDDCQAPNKTP